MRNNERVNQESKLTSVNLQSSAASEQTVRDSTRVAYHEISGLRHETKDVLKQLHNNILLLEDLGGRLGFVMSEVRSLIRR